MWTRVLPVVPVSFFAMVMGLVGLTLAWRRAVLAWALPALPGEAIGWCGVALWALLIVLYGVKWCIARPAAVAELHHPVQSGFVGLAGVATMLAGLIVLPTSRIFALAIIAPGMVWSLGFVIWSTGRQWMGGRELTSLTPAFYLPMGAGGFVTAIALAALGWRDWAVLAWGAAAFSSFGIESVVLHRLYHAAPLPPPLRPTLGVILAVPTVASISYLAAFGNDGALFVQALLGYGLLQAILLARLMPWVIEGGFSPGLWAYSFGLAALANASIQLGAHSGAWATLAPLLFGVASLLIAALALGTIMLLLRGRLLPVRSA